MLRNIPNRYTPEELLREFVGKGFEEAFDFFYLPIDFKTKKNKGFGFLNLRSTALSDDFCKCFHGHHPSKYRTNKVFAMSPADTQGLEANVQKYLQQAGGRVTNPWFKPMIFVASGGKREWLPLSQEHLPEDLRRRIYTRAEKTQVERTRADENCDDCRTGQDVALDMGDATTLEQEIVNSVGEFLRSCCGPDKAAGQSRGRRRRGRRKETPRFLASTTASDVAEN